jgi:Domain of unknown function (DUF4440)
MRAALLLSILFLSTSLAEDPEEKIILTTVQHLFDAMSAHDAEAARSVLIPEGRVSGVSASGKPTNVSQEDFAARLGTAKQKYLERMWNPKVQARNGIATVWAEYDFHLDGKFHHCGIDSFSLVKTPEGWRIAGIVYSVETTGCTPSPLGPPVL